MNPREAREYRPDFIQILIKFKNSVYTKANKIEQVNMWSVLQLTIFNRRFNIST